MASPIISEEGRGLSWRKKKHRMSDPGALVIEHAEPSDAGQSELQAQIQFSLKWIFNLDLQWHKSCSSLTGVYTCVAWNIEGADTKSVSVFVDSQGYAGSWSGGGNDPSRERTWLGNSSSGAGSLVVLAKVRFVLHVLYEQV